MEQVEAKTEYKIGNTQYILKEEIIMNKENEELTSTEYLEYLKSEIENIDNLDHAIVLCGSNETIRQIADAIHSRLVGYDPYINNSIILNFRSDTILKEGKPETINRIMLLYFDGAENPEGFDIDTKFLSDYGFVGVLRL